MIFYEMGICQPVRLLKGKKMLREAATLEQCQLTHGATVNIVTEPEKNVNLKVKIGQKKVAITVSNCVSDYQLKKQLIQNDVVGFTAREMKLVVQNGDGDDYDGECEDTSISDMSFPLHLYGIGENTTVEVSGENVMIQLISHGKGRLFKSFPVGMSFKQMKAAIDRKNGIFGGTNNIWMFLEKKGSFLKLDVNSEEPIGTLMSNNDLVHLRVVSRTVAMIYATEIMAKNIRQMGGVFAKKSTSVSQSAVDGRINLR